MENEPLFGVLQSFYLKIRKIPHEGSSFGVLVDCGFAGIFLKICSKISSKLSANILPQIFYSNMFWL